MKLKLSTLVRIAKEIEREHRIRPHRRTTVSEMWEQLDQAAGHCRTKAEAKAAIEEKVYNIARED